MSELDVDRAAWLERGIREILEGGGGPCSFFACPGANHPPVAMATCNVCYPQIMLKELIGEPVSECTDNPCGVCGRDIRCAEPVEWDNGQGVVSLEPCWLLLDHEGECEA